MAKYNLVATSAFGLEAVVKREIEKLGCEILESKDGRITFSGDEKDIARANIWLRCADRVYIEIASFKAKTFPELIEKSEQIDWASYIPADGKFTVIGTSVKSALHSVPSCQATIKMAAVKCLQKRYKTDVLKEDGAEYTIRFSVLKDEFSIMLNTSGEALHKRGYRVKNVEAPIKETLAAAMVELSYFRPGKLMLDPFCGSCTLPIESAMIGKNIAPGLSRHFAAEEWSFIPKSVWQEARAEAFRAIDNDADIRIIASDIDTRAIFASTANIEEAGVDDCIQLKRMDAADISADEEYGVIITNPPYGQRIGEQKAIDRLYKKLAEFMKKNPTWSLFLITADKTFEEKFGRLADRRRKLYNGRIETCLYQYHGTKPPKKQ